MMNAYRIESMSGQDMGTWEAADRLRALCEMHLDAGYDCYVAHGRLNFEEPDDANRAGGLSSWIVERVEE